MIKFYYVYHFITNKKICDIIHLMNKDFLKEKIGYYRNLLTLFWTSSFLIGSGICWSIVHLPKFNFLMPIGLAVITAFLVLFLFLHMRIKKLLRGLDK